VRAVLAGELWFPETSGVKADPLDAQLAAQILQKLGVNSRTQAALVAERFSGGNH
jgi:hypothetical protein